MSEMVERVAAAIAKASAGDFTLADRGDAPLTIDPRAERLRIARAAIEAMREPTLDMLDAGDREAEHDGEAIADIYGAMIHAALNPLQRP